MSGGVLLFRHFFTEYFYNTFNICKNTCYLFAPHKPWYPIAYESSNLMHKPWCFSSPFLNRNFSSSVGTHCPWHHSKLLNWNFHDLVDHWWCSCLILQDLQKFDSSSDLRVPVFDFRHSIQCGRLLQEKSFEIETAANINHQSWFTRHGTLLAHFSTENFRFALDTTLLMPSTIVHSIL